MAVNDNNILLPKRRVLYGGDYEAQRHWMELTWHLPPSDWYYYDLPYWGLDYPPLSAYQSYLCGGLSHYLVGPQSVALFTSRAYEDATHKALLRATVLVLDMLVYGTAVWTILSSSCLKKKTNGVFGWRFVIAMSQPAMLLIDHGHFQYNTTALGLALWSFYYCTRQSSSSTTTTTTTTGSGGWSTRHAVCGSILFCLALNFKQMALYYAPAVFAYLLGRCCCCAVDHNTINDDMSSSSDKDNNQQCRRRQQKQRFNSFAQRFVTLGVTVIVCFALLWWPVVAHRPNPPQHYPDEDGGLVDYNKQGVSLLQRIRHVLHRILPFQRGLFQAKVSNLWCALSVKPIRFQQRVPSHWQPLLATMVTFLLILPACIQLFRVGAASATSSTTSSRRHQNNGDKKTVTGADKKDIENDHLQMLLWGTTSTGLAFFLASFQVHEKSLLLALAPATLLLTSANTTNATSSSSSNSCQQYGCMHREFPHWFAIVTTWTLWPLLVLDRLQVAYVATLVIFLALLRFWDLSAAAMACGTTTTSTSASAAPGKAFMPWSDLVWIVASRSSYIVMIALHVAEVFVSPPSNLPDLFPVLWTLVGCAFCCFAWLVTCWHLMYEQPQQPLSGPADKFIKCD
jgi:alpha-1,3-glucosyltransferase